MRKKGKWLLRKHTSCLTGDGDGDCDGEGEGDGDDDDDDDGDGEGEGDDDGDGDGEVANDESSKKNIVQDQIIQKIASLFFFSEGTVTNPVIWLVLYPVSIFLSLPTGNGNAFVSPWVHPYFRCHFS